MASARYTPFRVDHAMKNTMIERKYDQSSTLAT